MNEFPRGPSTATKIFLGEISFSLLTSSRVQPGRLKSKSKTGALFTTTYTIEIMSLDNGNALRHQSEGLEVASVAEIVVP